MLRSYQREAIDRFLQSKTRRLVICHGMGSGKTATAITAAREAGYQRVLVVAPAMTRPAWAREFARWWPEVTPGVITHGPTAKNLTKAEAARREYAYQAPVQVVSYNLLHHLKPSALDLLIVDEAHRLRSPTSKQTKAVREFTKNNPKTAILELTGTLVPNEVRQLWAPIDVLQPGIFGVAQATGKEPWKFLNKYCHRMVNEYGTSHHGFREETRCDLLSKLAPLVHEVSEAEVAPYLPPLHVEPLYVDGSPSATELAIDWLEDTLHEHTHVGVFCHLNETREKLSSELFAIGHPVFEVTAADSAEERDRILARAAAAPRAVVVSKTHALQEGISLSFCKSALVVEWVTAMDQVLQFIGRFARQDSANLMPTYVRFAVRDEDADRAARLSTRVANKNALLLPGRAEELATTTFKAREYSDDDYAAMEAAAFASYNTAKEGYDNEAEED